MNDPITRRNFGKIISGAAIGSTVSVHKFLSPAELLATDNLGRDIFPYGAHVYREPHLPMDQLRHDFPILKHLGFNMIKIQEVWAYDEAEEGRIDLSNVSQVIADAQQNGLRVYFGITMEDAPAWFWKKYPEASMVYETGAPHNDPSQYVLPDDGKPGPCWHNPNALERGIRFVEAVGREIGILDNIEVWNVFQEIGLWQERPGHLGLCYCPYTLAAFRNWLRGRYISISKLNATWRTAYADWDEIQPPRMSPKVPSYIDFRYFMDDDYLSFSLKWKVDALRRTAGARRPILAHVANVTLGSTKEWRYSQELDILGSSCYPAWEGINPWDYNHSTAKPMSEAIQANHEVRDILMHFEYLRSAKGDGNIWTAELQGGPFTEGLNRRRVPTASDMRRWVFSCLAAGSRGICYWNHRPEIFWEEGYGFSLLDWGSDNSERATEAGRLGKAINAHAELFAHGEHPKPEIAIAVDEDLFHFAQGSLHDVSQHLEYTIAGNWKSFWRRGYSVDFVNLQKSPAHALTYKLLLLPFPMALSQAAIDNMHAFVKAGGTVVAEACPGRFSNYGIGFPGAMAPGVAELFGAEHRDVSLIREPENGSKWSIMELGPRDQCRFQYLEGTGTFSGRSLFPSFYLQTLTPVGGTPIFRYKGEIAGCFNQVGEGRAYLFGTLLGHAGPAYDDWRNADVLSFIAAECGIKSDSVGQLGRRRRVLHDRAAWFFFNSAETGVEENIALERYKSAHDLLGGTLAVSSNSIRVRVDPLDVRCILLQT